MTTTHTTAKEATLRLRNIRKDKGLTQQQLADKVGCKQQHIAGIENGTRTPSLATIIKISQALGVQTTIRIKE